MDEISINVMATGGLVTCLDTDVHLIDQPVTVGSDEAHRCKQRRRLDNWCERLLIQPAGVEHSANGDDPAGGSG